MDLMEVLTLKKYQHILDDEKNIFNYYLFYFNWMQMFKRTKI